MRFKEMSYLTICVSLFSISSLHAAVDGVPRVPGQPDTVVQSKWEAFKKKYKKNYAPAEDQKRYAIFKSNLAKIDQLNSKNRDENGDNPFGINKFADIDPTEFARTRLNFRHNERGDIGDAPALPVSAEALPANFDWRDKGAVTPVKDQGACGSCWAFSAVEELETALFMASGKLLKLSPQQINSCSTVDQGCNGGDTTSAYDYMKKYGVESGSMYPYKSGESSQTEACYYNAKRVVAHMTGYHYTVPPCLKNGSKACDAQTAEEPALQVALVRTGPASICLNASTWQYYSGGVISGSNCGADLDTMNHCIQLVGYATNTNKNNYWIGRNQWGADWGINGYIHLQMGTNTCGMVNEVTQVDGAAQALNPEMDAPESLR
jgi:C1A family cysteine protease